jgi:hypothetical protein
MTIANKLSFVSTAAYQFVRVLRISNHARGIVSRSFFFVGNRHCAFMSRNELRSEAVLGFEALIRRVTEIPPVSENIIVLLMKLNQVRISETPNARIACLRCCDTSAA